MCMDTYGVFVASLHFNFCFPNEPGEPWWFLFSTGTPAEHLIGLNSLFGCWAVAHHRDCCVTGCYSLLPCDSGNSEFGNIHDMWNHCGAWRRLTSLALFGYLHFLRFSNIFNWAQAVTANLNADTSSHFTHLNARLLHWLDLMRVGSH